MKPVKQYDRKELKQDIKVTLPEEIAACSDELINSIADWLAQLLIGEKLKDAIIQ